MMTDSTMVDKTTRIIELKEAIEKIIQSHYGIDRYGILAKLVSDYSYDYMKDHNFENYLDDVCKQKSITEQNGKFYYPVTYLIPAKINGSLEIGSCNECQFKVRAGDVERYVQFSPPLRSGQIYVCGLNTDIRFDSGKGDKVHKACARNALHKLIHESEARDESEDDQKPEDTLASDGTKEAAIPYDLINGGSISLDTSNSIKLNDINQYVKSVSSAISDTSISETYKSVTQAYYQSLHNIISQLPKMMEQSPIAIDPKMEIKTEEDICNVYDDGTSRKIPYPGLKHEIDKGR